MNLAQWSQIIGGLGLFLFGVSTLTQGIRDLKGPLFSKLLKKLTGNSLSSVIAGTLFTFMVQSSTATIFVFMGFLSAELISLIQTMALVFGANLGTACSSWLVNLLNINVSFSTLALPFVGIGALLRVSPKYFKALGTPVLGFGLFFLGLSYLKEGFEGFSQFISQFHFAPEIFTGRVLLVLIGIGLTLLLQSSIASVAIVITATMTNALSGEEGMALTIGANIGITLTIFLGSLGTGFQAKRVAVGNIFFNVAVGVISIIFFNPIVHQLVYLTDFMGLNSVSSQVTLFHTIYNFIGIVVLTPFLKPIEKRLRRLYADAEKASRLDQYLDPGLIKTPNLAMEASTKELQHIKHLIQQLIENGLKKLPSKEGIVSLVVQTKMRRKNIEKLTQQYVNYLESLNPEDLSEQDRQQFLTLITIADNLKMASGYFNQAVKLRPFMKAGSTGLENSRKEYEQILREVSTIAFNGFEGYSKEDISAYREKARSLRHNIRTEIFKGTSKGLYDYQEGITLADYVSHLDRTISHLCRISRVTDSPIVWDKEAAKDEEEE